MEGGEDERKVHFHSRPHVSQSLGRARDHAAVRQQQQQQQPAQPRPGQPASQPVRPQSVNQSIRPSTYTLSLSHTQSLARPRSASRARARRQSQGEGKGLTGESPLSPAKPSLASQKIQKRAGAASLSAPPSPPIHTSPTKAADLAQPTRGGKREKKKRSLCRAACTTLSMILSGRISLSLFPSFPFSLFKAATQ